MHLSTQRATLGLFMPDDAPDIFAHISPVITRFMAWEPPATPADFEEIWRGWLDTAEEGAEFHFVARSRDDNRFLGVVGVHAARSDTPELGIWLRSDMHGKGLGRELIGAVIGWASRSLPVRHFEYPVAEDNIASRRMAEAFGGEVKERRSNPKYRSVVYHVPPAADIT